MLNILDKKVLFKFQDWKWIILNDEYLNSRMGICFDKGKGSHKKPYILKLLMKKLKNGWTLG